LGFNINPSLNAAAGKMGGYTDTAMGEMRNRQLQSENMLQAQVSRAANDPAWRTARKLAMEQAQNPGIPKAILDRLQGRVAARSAASTAASLRGVMSRAARGGMGDSAVLNASQLANNRGAINHQNGALDLDRWAAEIANNDKKQAISQLAGVAQGSQAAQMGPLRDLVSTMGRYNPLSQMQQVQGIMQPLNGLGYGVGLTGGVGQPQAAPAAPQAMPTVTLPKKPATSRALGSPEWMQLLADPPSFEQRFIPYMKPTAKQRNMDPTQFGLPELAQLAMAGGLRGAIL